MAGLRLHRELVMKVTKSRPPLSLSDLSPDAYFSFLFYIQLHQPSPLMA